MKKFLVAILLVSTQFAMATSLRNVRLQYTSKPIGPFVSRAQLAEKTIVVYLGGEVRLNTCPKGIHFGPCTSKRVTLLNARQMDRIERDIQEAREGEILPPPTIRCRALPVKQVDYTADNHSIVLLQGAIPCGAETRNASPAAQRLVELLNKLSLKAAPIEPQ